MSTSSLRRVQPNAFTEEQYRLDAGSEGIWLNSTQTTGAHFLSNNTEQRQVTQQTGFYTPTIGGTYEAVFSTFVGDAPISTVLAALSASDMASQVGDLHFFNGFLSTNPLLTAPAGGWDPASTENYDDNIDRS